MSEQAVVLIRADEDSEMLEVLVNGELVLSDNYWDFHSTKEVLETLATKLGARVEIEDYFS